MEQYVKGFGNGFNRGNKRHKSKMNNDGSLRIDCQLPNPGLKKKESGTALETERVSPAGTSGLKDMSKQQSMMKVPSQQRSTDTFRLAEAQSPTLPGHMLDIAPLKGATIVSSNPADQYMKIDTQNEFRRQNSHNRSTLGLKVKKTPDRKDNDDGPLLPEPNSPDALHYAESNANLQARNLDERSAASSSEAAGHQVLVPLSLNLNMSQFAPKDLNMAPSGREKTPLDRQKAM